MELRVTGVDLGACLRRFRGRLQHVTVATLLLWSAAVSAAVTDYYYDDLGRLVQAVRADGSVLQYQYDANGNIQAINRVGASTLTISGLAPLVGHVGASMTIFGSGFSATTSANQVSFGAVQATITSATTSTLVVTVPFGAQTGPVTVVTAAGSVTSAMSYVVRRPIITSFSPAVVATGNQVTLLGSNLNIVPGGTAVSLRGTPANLISVSDSRILFSVPAGVGSGPIAVNTPYGNTVSATDLIVAPPALGVANVVSTAQLSQATAQTLTVSQSGRYGVFTFNAVEGQYLSMQMSALSITPSNMVIQYHLYSPTNVLLASGSKSNSERTVHLPRIPTTGTYLLAFGSGSGSVQLTAMLEIDPKFDRSGSVVSGSVASQQTKRAIFDGAAGENVSVALTSLALNPNSGSLVLHLVRPDGWGMESRVCVPTSIPGCQVSGRSLPMTGAYSVIVDPLAEQSATYDLRLLENVSAQLALDTPLAVNLANAGQNASLTFIATAGQTVALNVGNVSTVPANKSTNVAVYNSAGNTVGSSSAVGSVTVNLRNLAAGSYFVLVSIQDAAPATMQVTLASGLTGVLAIDGSTTAHAASVRDQTGYFTFTGAVGDNLSLALTNLVLLPNQQNVNIAVTPPSGSFFNSTNCAPSNVPGCSLSLRNLPVAGTYTVWVDPVDTIPSFNLTLSRNFSAALMPDVPVAVNLNSTGQHASFTFTATADQTVALNASSIATSPANKGARIRVFQPNGTAMPEAAGVGNVTQNLTNLAAGTYSALVQIDDAATGAMQVTLASGAAGVLTPDGTTKSYRTTVPAQRAFFTFSATAGDNLGLGLTGLSLTPSSGNVSVAVNRPNGAALISFSCDQSSLPGCVGNLRNLPESGTYRVILTPSSQQTMAFTLTLSRSITGALALGTPASVNLSVPGKNAVFSFSKTAGQTITLTIASVTTTPTGRAVTVNVHNTSGTLVATASGTNNLAPSLSNLAAGNYTVLIFVAAAATANMQATLQ